MRSSRGRAVPVGLVCAALLSTSLMLAVRADANPSDGAQAPTRAEVDAAADAAAAKERDVAVVRAELVLVNQRAQDASVRTAQAFEAWNAARWQLQEARRAVRAAEAAEAQAADDLAVQDAAYGRTLAANYEMAPELSSIGTIMGEDGIDGVVDQTNTLYNATTAAHDVKAAYEASVEVAEIRRGEADGARQAAADLAEKTDQARRTAQRRQDAALAEASAVARQKETLVAELASLQQVSLEVAARRQTALEERAQVRAAEAAEDARQVAAQQEQTTPDEPAPNTPAPNNPAPTPPAPQNGSAVERAIAFAKAQLGETYRWGAAGPNAWDCSGLTMGAWQAGGVSLPHYSVGQYAAATPIRSSDLRAGDLVFWGSADNPNSIHHVALYIGDGQIIHAPRTGRPVTQESLHYWIEPNFYARP